MSVCKLKKYLPYGGNLYDCTRSGPERKKMVYFPLWEDVMVWLGELNIEVMAGNVKSTINQEL